MLFRSVMWSAVLLSALVSLACSLRADQGSAAIAATPTPASPQAGASAQPPGQGTPSSQGSLPPSEFLQAIAGALERGDIRALVQLTRESELDCRTNCPAMGCDPQQCGQTRRGFPIGHWRSEPSLVSREDLPGTLSRLFATPQAGARDRHGTGALRLAGVGTGNHQTFDAIATLIQQDGRRAVLLRLEPAGGRWWIGAAVSVDIPFVDEVLGSTSGDYRMVQPWP